MFEKSRTKLLFLGLGALIGLALVAAAVRTGFERSGEVRGGLRKATDARVDVQLGEVADPSRRSRTGNDEHRVVRDGKLASNATTFQEGGRLAPHGQAGGLSTKQLVKEHEALPCTAPNEPSNFEIYTAGPSVAGLSLTGTNRTCESRVPVGERPANSMTYFYGQCEIGEGETGCELPLQVQTWPACQRSLADYEYEGRPEPFNKLPSQDGAEVVEIEFISGPRIEVYTKSSTVVIFAESRELALEAVERLAPEPQNEPPADTAGEIQELPQKPLSAPVDGATEGTLPCQG